MKNLREAHIGTSFQFWLYVLYWISSKKKTQIENVVGVPTANPSIIQKGPKNAKLRGYASNLEGCQADVRRGTASVPCSDFMRIQFGVWGYPHLTICIGATLLPVGMGGPVFRPWWGACRGRRGAQRLILLGCANPCWCGPGEVNPWSRALISRDSRLILDHVQLWLCSIYSFLG